MTPSQKKHIEQFGIEDYTEANGKIYYTTRKDIDGYLIEQITTVGKRGGVFRLTRINGGEWK